MECACACIFMDVTSQFRQINIHTQIHIHTQKHTQTQIQTQTQTQTHTHQGISTLHIHYLRATLGGLHALHTDTGTQIKYTDKDTAKDTAKNYTHTAKYGHADPGTETQEHTQEKQE